MSNFENDPNILFATRANTLRVAAKDIETFAARPGCVVDMSQWNNICGDACYACQAGAVAIQSLGVPHDEDIFDNAPLWVEEIFKLLNQVRQGSLYYLLFGKGGKSWSTITYERCAEVLEMYGIRGTGVTSAVDLRVWLEEDFVPYGASPQKYIDWLHSVANVLDELEK